MMKHLEFDFDKEGPRNVLKNGNRYVITPTGGITIFLRFLVRGVFITALRLGFVVLAQDKKLDRIRVETLRHDAP
jgi:hypothetical protein